MCRKSRKGVLKVVGSERLLDINKAIKMMKSRPEFRSVLMEVKEKVFV